MISVVVPIYNEIEVLPEFHQRTGAMLQSLHEDWELIYVNDGSSDGSYEMLAKFSDCDARVILIDLSRNWGHQAALTAGIRAARGEAVVMIDGDLQDPPELIPEFIEKWHQGAEVVIAQRRSRKERGTRGLLFRGFHKVFGYIADFPIEANTGIFGLLDSQAAEAVVSLDERNRFLPGLRAWVGFKAVSVYYDREERFAGQPKQTVRRLFRYALNGIFSFSYKPLRLSLALGALSAVFALLCATILVVCRLFRIGLFGEPMVVGYTSIIVCVLFFGGIQLFCVGLVGEYIGRIYDEVKRRPLYVVHRTRSRRVKAVEAARGGSGTH